MTAICPWVYRVPIPATRPLYARYARYAPAARPERGRS
jgi:hypothetical protein